ncbi:MAG: penicillin acylase family protein [Bacteroidota bacterium]
MLLEWDFIMDKNSVPAGIYLAWEKKISSEMVSKVVPANAKKYIRSVPLSKVIDWTTSPGSVFGKNATSGRDQFLIATLEQAVKGLEAKLGADKTKWQLGQPSYHHTLIKHMLSNVVNDSTRKLLDAGPLARGGSASTPGVTSNSDNQTHGASFRIVTDVSDWDKAMLPTHRDKAAIPEASSIKISLISGQMILTSPFTSAGIRLRNQQKKKYFTSLK